MIGFGRDIEAAIDTMIQGLEYSIDVESLEPTKLKTLMKSKENSFKYAKEMIHKWENSQNQPNPDKLKAYIERLVDAGDKALITLRQFLREKIDYSEIDEDKHHLVTEGKSVLHQAIVNIDSNLIELRLQIDADNFNLSDKEFKRGYPEKFANQEFFPLKNYYKDWYDIENDSIVICPKGTRGKIITLEGLNITLPKEPEDKTKILYHDLPKEEQYWQRKEMPKGLTIESEESFTDYIVEEYKRRREGVWFYNNGEAVWLPPSFYFALQWCKMKDDGDYMKFRYAQLDMAYHAEACKLDTRCLGELFVKSRRTGFTYEKIFRFLDEATSTNNANFGITSKTDKDAKEAFSKLSYAFQNLPFFFQPITKNSVDNSKYLHFAKPPDRSKKAKKSKDTNTDDYLNTYIDYKPTSEGSYDGYKMYRYLGDECLAKGTKILMADMSFKKIEDVKVGEEVMVEGGKKMKVKHASNGVDDMYRVVQPYGKDYVVNSNHKLYLEKGNGKENKEYIKITPKEYINQSNYQKKITNRVLFSGVEFENRDFKIPPYLMGCWIGDGYSSGFRILVNHEKDQEIIKEFKKFCDNKNLLFKQYIRTDAKNMSILSARKKTNNKAGEKTYLNKELDRLNLRKNKHIPDEYFFSSKKQRLELLAGIIDTDGYIGRSSYVIGMSKKYIIDSIYRLAKSCGLDVSEVSHRKTNYNTDVFSIRILSTPEIKCRIKRKQKNSKGCYRSRRSKMDVVYEGFGEYYGIELDTDNDDDKRLILEDYTLTMNCSKWDNGKNFENHWGQVSPTFDEGGKIVGKAYLGSTVAARKKGGEAFHKLWKASDIDKRDKVTERTPTGLYRYFLPAHKNMTEFTDKYGKCHEVVTDGEYFENVHGNIKKVGSIAYLEARRKSKRKESEIAYNEELRAFPMTPNEAFRDEAVNCIFNIEKINEQLDYVDQSKFAEQVMEGSFSWKGGIPDTEVVWTPSKNGHFKVTWIPPVDLRNRWENKLGYGGYSRSPLNGDIGVFGCDSYDISGTVDGVNKFGKERDNAGSKGALIGVTKFTMQDVPSEHFFLEYVARESTADKFFENVLMACVFFGMPILIENNKPRLLYHFKNRGYRNFAITRFDRPMNTLSKAEKEIGGVPNSSEDMKQMHASAIEGYIDEHIGYNQEEGDYGKMFFDRTLRDWLNFDINNRTKYDATIASGLALMAKNMEKYSVNKQKPNAIKINIKR